MGKASELEAEKRGLGKVLRDAALAGHADIFNMAKYCLDSCWDIYHACIALNSYQLSWEFDAR